MKEEGGKTSLPTKIAAAVRDSQARRLCAT